MHKLRAQKGGFGGGGAEGLGWESRGRGEGEGRAVGEKGGCWGGGVRILSRLL